MQHGYDKDASQILTKTSVGWVRAETPLHKTSMTQYFRVTDFFFFYKIYTICYCLVKCFMVIRTHVTHFLIFRRGKKAARFLPVVFYPKIQILQNKTYQLVAHALVPI